MLELTGLSLFPFDVDKNYKNERELLIKLAARKLKIPTSAFNEVEIKKASIDARKKDQVKLLYSIRFNLNDPVLTKQLLNKYKQLNEVEVSPSSFTKSRPWSNISSPLVVGGGCAGIFAALELAHAGLCPILIERGQSAFARQTTIHAFNEGADLNTESNIQFGIGGAGTFSDGKLSTGTKSPIHRLILETLVQAGANPRILFEAKPHVGSDVLIRVVDILCKKIEELGGTVLYNTKMIDLIEKDGSIKGVIVETQENDSIKSDRIMSDNVVLCCGHSARDVFRMLSDHKLTLERKTFAMGVRIEHLQSDINESQYGKKFAQAPALGAAPYKLVAHVDDRRSAFTFCMCPGGYVVAATSEKNAVVTNGMSLSNRAGINANSGLLANVFPDDLPGDSPLAGIELQAACEKKAYDLGGGDYRAPATLVRDFLQKRPSCGPSHIIPTYPRKVTYTDVSQCLPDYIAMTLRHALPMMARKLKAFGDDSAVLTGIESRSSSPIRIKRNEDLMSVDLEGLWPCGEGAGYAGGIMSAATDGIRVARAIIESLK